MSSSAEASAGAPANADSGYALWAVLRRDPANPADPAANLTAAIAAVEAKGIALVHDEVVEVGAHDRSSADMPGLGGRRGTDHSWRHSVQDHGVGQVAREVAGEVLELHEHAARAVVVTQ